MAAMSLGGLTAVLLLSHVNPFFGSPILAMFLLSGILRLVVAVTMLPRVREPRRNGQTRTEEPLMVPAIIQGGLSAVLVLILGKYFAAIGIAVSCLLVNLVNLPSIAIIWYRCRLIWHSEDYVAKA